MTLQRLAQSVVLLEGWRRRGVAMFAGAFAALALAPVHALPVLALSLPLAIWLLDGTAGDGGRSLPALRQAFGIGWWFGFGYFLAGLWWIGMAFLVDPTFTWLLPVAVTLLPAGLALFTAFGFALARAFWSRGADRVLVFAVAVAAGEWLRGTVLTGFPWNGFGYALTGWLWPAQALSVVGIAGVTLLTLAIFAAPATLADPVPRRRPVVVAAMALIALSLFGAARLALHDPPDVPGVALRLMQPDIAQDDKFRPERKDEILATYFELSDRATSPSTPGLSAVTHLIWPESAFPFIVSRDADALARIGELLPANTTLITGAGRAEDPLGEDEAVRYFNAIHVIDSTGAILDSYDKVHLVPFGEYLPFQTALESLGLRQLTRLRGGFTPGPRLRTMDVPGAPPVGMLICYEAIFSGAVVDPDRRPEWLLNLTNDAWFGLTPGPWQHFEQARARAIEEGLPLVRVANNGISAVIDPVGRVRARTDLGVRDVIDHPLPGHIAATVFAQTRNLGFVAGLVVCLIWIVAVRLRERRHMLSV